MSRIPSLSIVIALHPMGVVDFYVRWPWSLRALTHGRLPCALYNTSFRYFLAITCLYTPTFLSLCLSLTYSPSKWKHLSSLQRVRLHTSLLPVNCITDFSYSSELRRREEASRAEEKGQREERCRPRRKGQGRSKTQGGKRERSARHQYNNRSVQLEKLETRYWSRAQGLRISVRLTKM